MVIKELEVSGFKSFATKTRIKFAGNISGVVGPNGCGKSNILDAMKWVMGEKSVKAIRGDKMEDVIFSGTEHKKPANFAQVSLTLDNESGLLPIDMKEVKIGRRLYRDGQSQYLLNDSRVPRREIENLLMDTGIGKTSYSFMEQGRMDMILSSKPEDRRYIFEEAAGISRFKAQRDEARKNLDNTAVNLTRVKDILNELERELKIKSAQAEKTVAYNELLAGRKEHDLRIRFLTLKEINKGLAALEEKLSRKKTEREKIQQKMLQIDEQVEQTDSERDDLFEQLRQKDIANQVSREKIQQWQSQLVEIENRKKAYEEEKKNLSEQVQKIDRRVKNLKSEMARQNQLTLELDTRIEDAEAARDSVEKKIKKNEQAIADFEKQIKDNHTEHEDTQNDLKISREEHAVAIEDLLNSLKQEKEGWAEFEKSKSESTKAVISIVNNLRTIISEITETESIETVRLKAESALDEIDGQNLKDKISNLSRLKESLRYLLFEKGGVHSRKEELDSIITAHEKKLVELEQNRYRLQESLKTTREDLSQAVQQREAIIGDIKSYQIQKQGLQEKEKNLKEQIEHEEASLAFVSRQHSRTEKEILLLTSERKDTEKNISDLKTGIEKEAKIINTLETSIQKLENKRHTLLEQVRKETEKTNAIFQAANEIEIKIGTMLGSREALVQDIYNDYSMTIEEVESKIGKSRFQMPSEKEKLSAIQKQIEELGPINPLAIEEKKTIEELYNHNETQLNDIMKAREDIIAVIDEIQQKSEKMFLDSFRQIEQNFRSVFQKLFKGGDVSLRLTEEENPLESGIEIQVQPPGKRPRSLRLLSGGEKALTAISLMFGIYMVRSSPFCVLDEIDAPLDDQNVGRFLTLLDDFSDKTQFILITHHKKTMAKADAIFGVTMEEPGVSKLLGVEIRSTE